MAAITLVHVAGGGLALLAGALAVALRKGSRAHGQAGSVFALAMVAMALPGGVLAVMSGKPFDVLSSAMSLYLVLSGWVAFQGLTTARIVWMLTGAACCLIGYLAVEGYALATGIRATDAPVGVGYVFAGLMLVAACGDVRYARGGYRRRQLMLRHLWRMNFGLFIATASFFGARPHLFPEWMQTSGILVLLSLAPLAIIAFWRIRLRARQHDHDHRASSHMRGRGIGQDHAGEAVR